MRTHPALFSFPATIVGTDGRELRVQLLGREDFCVKCKYVVTVAGYRDRTTRRVWPTCRRCALIAAGLIVPGTDFYP